ASGAPGQSDGGPRGATPDAAPRPAGVVAAAPPPAPERGALPPPADVLRSHSQVGFPSGVAADSLSARPANPQCPSPSPVRKRFLRTGGRFPVLVGHGPTEPHDVADHLRHRLVVFGIDFLVDLDGRIEGARERRIL